MVRIIILSIAPVCIFLVLYFIKEELMGILRFFFGVQQQEEAEETEEDRPAPEEEVCNVCGRPHRYMTRFNSPYSSWNELVCDDCLSKPLP